MIVAVMGQEKAPVLYRLYQWNGPGLVQIHNFGTAQPNNYWTDPLRMRYEHHEPAKPLKTRHIEFLTDNCNLQYNNCNVQ